MSIFTCKYMIKYNVTLCGSLLMCFINYILKIKYPKFTPVLADQVNIELFACGCPGHSHFLHPTAISQQLGITGSHRQR